MKKARKPRGYWTPERVLQELRERNEKGLSMRTKDVVKEAVSLYDYARKYYGSWHLALEEIGVDVVATHHRKIKEDRGFWTAEQVLLEIQKLKEQGENLDTTSVRKANGSLVSQSSIFFGGWYAALEASGLNPDDYRENKPKGYWTADTVGEEIRERAKLKLSIDPKDVAKEHSSIYYAAIRIYGSWYTAVDESGVSPDNYRVRNSHGYWTAERVLKEIQTREERGKSLMPADIIRNDRKLYNYAKQFHGSYRTALVLSGYNDMDYYVNKEPIKKKPGNN